MSHKVFQLAEQFQRKQEFEIFLISGQVQIKRSNLIDEKLLLSRIIVLVIHVLLLHFQYIVDPLEDALMVVRRLVFELVTFAIVLVVSLVYNDLMRLRVLTQSVKAEYS